MTRKVDLVRGISIVGTLTVTGVNEIQPDGSIRVSLETPSFQYDSPVLRLSPGSEQEIYDRLCQRHAYGQVWECRWRILG
jgi:hypothetical protein